MKVINECRGCWGENQKVEHIEFLQSALTRTCHITENYIPNCPCQECLVKMTCKITCSNRGEFFKNILKDKEATKQINQKIKKARTRTEYSKRHLKSIIKTRK